MDGRDAKGRFTKGHGGGPGRPRKQKAEYLDVMSDVLTLKAWRIIVKRAIKDAQGGDKAARAWLANYVLGRPVEHVKAEIVGVPMTVEQWKAERERRRKEAEEC